MKTRQATLRPQFAFTLIELITVIAIIAILMGLLFPAIQSMMENGRRTQANNAVRNIVNAAKAYSTDYGKYPPITAAESGSPTNAIYSYGETSVGCAVKNSELFNTLRAIPTGANANHVMNRRQQKYIEDKKISSKNPPREGFADGSDFSAIQGQFLDPWGKQYCVVLDKDGDEIIKLDSFFSDQTDDIRFSAVAFSLAKNGEIGGKGYAGKLKKPSSSEAPEDIVTW